MSQAAWREIKTPSKYQEWKLTRLAKRAERVRGEVMNLAWINASEAWEDYHDKVCGRSDCEHGDWNLKVKPTTRNR